MGQDEWKFLKSIPSHGTKQFLKVSRGIPWDEYFLQNFDFIMNSITVFVIDGSLANPGRKIRLSDPVGSYRKTIGFGRNPSEVDGILGIGFQQLPVGCRKVSEFRRSNTFRHPTTSYRNLVPRISTTSDRILSELLGFDGATSIWDFNRYKRDINDIMFASVSQTNGSRNDAHGESCARVVCARNKKLIFWILTENENVKM
jgi:hypothetical protein